LLGAVFGVGVIVRIEKPGYTGPNVDPGTPVASPAAEGTDRGPEAGLDAVPAGNDPVRSGDASTGSDALALSA